MSPLPSLGLALSAITAILSTTCEYKARQQKTAAAISSSSNAECINQNEELRSYPTAFLHGKPIYTTPSLTMLASEAAKAYHQIQQHWPNAEAQFSRLTSLSFYPQHPHRAGEANMHTGEVTFYGGEQGSTVNENAGNAAGALGPLECQYGRDFTLIHELAHVWHGFLLSEDRKALEQQWREIAQDAYDPYACDESRLYQPAHQISCRISAKQAAAVTAYGGKSLEEDVAELMEFAYQVLKCPAGQRLPKNHTIVSENVERIIQKLGLLEEYGFITEGVYEKAVGEMEKIWER